jgi:hypothetical protein
VPFYDRAVLIIFNPVEWALSGRVYPIIKSWNDVATVMMERFNTANKTRKETAAKAKRRRWTPTSCCWPRATGRL